MTRRDNLDSKSASLFSSPVVYFKSYAHRHLKLMLIVEVWRLLIWECLALVPKYESVVYDR